MPCLDVLTALRCPTGTAEDFASVGGLRRKAIVTDEEIKAAVDAFLEDPQLNAFRFASSHTLDVAVAVAEHTTASTVLADPKPKGEPVTKRGRVAFDRST